MRSTARTSLVVMTLGLGLLVLSSPARAQQQDLGHKVLGAVGLDAGVQPEPGLYIADRVFFYNATTLRDRNGNSVPVGLDLNVLSNGFGLAGIVKLSQLGTYFTVSAGGPLTHVSVNTTRPEASIDRFGLGDIFIQPLKLGWRWSHFDAVAAYAVYVPAGRFEPGGRGGVGRGQVTNEVSAGGTVYFDSAKTWRLSALTSYDLNSRKNGVDITRGATLQVQGGLGVRLFRILDLGVAGFALWQVSDDSGTDLPPVLRGARDRAFGLGPEVDVLIPPIRSRLTLRYEHDFGDRSRPEGQLLLVGLTVLAWQPKEP